MSLYSNYSSGFDSGLLIDNVLTYSPIPAKAFYVGNHATREDDEKGASDSSNRGIYNEPFSTVDYAIGQCKANNVNTIFVRPGYTESITAAAGWAMDVAGIQIIGLGAGSKRPTVTFTTSTAASVLPTAANCRISNFLFLNDIDAQAHMIDIGTASLSATDLTIDNCEFREGTAKNPLAFITADAADGCADRLRVINCRFYAPTAGASDAAIQLAKDFNGVRIVGCDIYGDFDNGGIEIPAGGNAQVDIIIKDCIIVNLLTGVGAIVVNGTSSTGKIIDCQVQTDTQSVAVDAGGLEVYNVLWHDGTDQTSAVDAIAPTDSTTNFIGIDDADNLAATTNVAANEDGSILERLEQIQEAVNKGTGTALAANKSLVDALGTDGTTVTDGTVSVLGAIGANSANNSFVSSSVVANVDGSLFERLEAIMDPTGAYLPGFGYKVTKSHNLTSDPGDLFTVTGKVMITLMTGEVTTIVATTTTYALIVKTTAEAISAATTITTDAAGTMYLVTGDAGDVFNGGEVPTTRVATHNGKGPFPFVLGLASGSLVIAGDLDGAGTGVIAWTLYYLPMESGATVVAA